MEKSTKTVQNHLQVSDDVVKANLTVRIDREKVNRF